MCRQRRGGGFPARGKATAVSGNPTLECLSALSVILDLANGFEEDKSLLTAVFALELAREAGCDPDVQASAFLAALLRHLGCTAYASVEATIATDDIALRSRLQHADSSRAADVIAAVAQSNDGLLEGGRGLLRLAAQARRIRTDWTREACGAARLLSEQLRLGPQVGRALDEVFERWDGQGTPRGLGGEDLSVVGRIGQAAHVAVVFWLAGGASLAREMLRARAGNALEPRAVDLALGHLHRLEDSSAEPLAVRLDSAAKVVGAVPLQTSVEDIAAAFGDFADLQTPFTRGHSRSVARVAGEAAVRLGLSAGEQRELRLAAHLHDLGKVAVPTSLWTRAHAFRPSERERARSHVYFTERVLASAAPLASVARIAGAHHERLDGSGYHRGLKAASIGRPARVLAAADVLCAMQEARPHRPAKTRAAAARELRELVVSGQLDGDCVDAVLGGPGSRGAPAPASVSSLTAREVDVLRLVALGKTNKEIAQQLGISDRTVQHHTIHIYGKLGVDTRAAAALLAARYGLLEVV